MANIDYVTSHQGQAHITTQNVIDLLAGLSGDVRGIKKFPQLYNGLSHEITDALTIQVKTGAALAGGSFFILEDAYDWLLDPGTVGYSRIDILFLVMYEDPDTSVQSCDFVYEVGNLYPNGTTGTAPDAPTGTNITATYPFLRMDMTDGSIVSVTDYAQPYLSNSSLVETVGGTVEQVQTNTNEIAQMKITFQDGVDTIYNGLTTRGMSPTASTPKALSDAVGEGLGNLYDYAWAYGHDSGIGHDDATIDEVKSAIDEITEVTWTEDFEIEATDDTISAGDWNGANPTISLSNIVKYKMTSQSVSSYLSVAITYYNSGGSIVGRTFYPTLNTEYTPPTGAVKMKITIKASRVHSCTVIFSITRQAKILR